MARRVLHPPQPPALPDTLPLEGPVDRLLNRAAAALDKSPLVAAARRFEDKLPEVMSMDFPTPLGSITTPHFRFPTLSPPAIDDRKRQAVKAAMGDDLAGLVGAIPFVGFLTSPIGDAIEDTFMDKLHQTLTPQEREAFRNNDKVSPSTTLAVLRTFVSGARP